ncbi:MAG: GNAT family N-acetyltransferase [Nitratireductor sp.]
MPIDTQDISFRPVTPDDYPVLRTWLDSPHLRRWWGEPEVELGYIRDMVEGRDTTHPFIILLDGAPVGYIQYWHVGHHQNEDWIADHPWLAEFLPETVGVDISIGEENMLSKGIGSAALGAFTRMLREQGHTTIIIDPDPNNRRAIRAYEKAGYRPIPHLAGRTGDCLLMQHGENTKEIPS